MKIDEVYIKEFGPYRDWSFTPKTDGVQLIYGPNESGKTSLLEAVRSFIFGKRGKTYKEGNTYHPWKTVLVTSPYPKNLA